MFLLNNRNRLLRVHNPALTTGLACLPISTQTSQIELVLQHMQTIGTWADTLEYARKHRDLFKTQEIDRVAITAKFVSRINFLRAYAMHTVPGWAKHPQPVANPT